MNMQGLGPQASDLLREAHRDVPSHAQRAQMWQGIEAGVVGGAVAAGTVKAMSGLTKILLGVFIGGAITAGLTMGAVVSKGHGDAATSGDLGFGAQRVMVDHDTPEAPGVVVGSITSPANGTDLELGSNGDVIGAASDDVGGSNALAALTPLSGGAGTAKKTDVSHGGSSGSTHATNSASHEDPLVREARLVAEARGALLRGDSNQALRLLKIVRAMPNPALEPEELALEARALRDLERDTEADAVERDLAKRFPENALGR